MPLITLAQLQSATQRVAAFLDTKANTVDLLTKEELQIICASRPLEFSTGCVGVMNKFGLHLKTHSEYVSELGGNWSVEFFIKLNSALTSYLASSAMHFALIDSNGNGLALGLSKSDTTGGHPCESFFLGAISSPNTAVYFDSLEVSIADGARHHVLIEHYSRETSANIAVYIDGALVVANNFDTVITDFKNLVFGADAFLDTPCVKNLATFDRIRMLGEVRYLLDGSSIAATITVPTAFEIGDSTLIFYQNGMLNVFIEDAASSTAG